MGKSNACHTTNPDLPAERARSICAIAKEGAGILSYDQGSFSSAHRLAPLLDSYRSETSAISGIVGVGEILAYSPRPTGTQSFC